MNTHRMISAICVLLVVAAVAQNPVWFRNYGDPTEVAHSPFKLVSGESGYIYGAGGMAAPELTLDGHVATGGGRQDVLIVKWDTAGAVQWVRTAGGNNPNDSEDANTVTFDPLSQRLIVSGTFFGGTAQFGDHALEGLDPFGDYESFVAAFDTDGECLWARSLTGDAGPPAILTDANSHVWASGGCGLGGVNITGGADAWIYPSSGYVAHYDENGVLLSAERVMENGSVAIVSSDVAGRIYRGVARPNAVFFGEAIPFATTTAGVAFVAKMDTNDEVVWMTHFPTSNFTSVTARMDAFGNTIVRGTFRDSLFLPTDTLLGEPGESTFFLAKLDPLGAIQWVVPVRAPSGGFMNDLDVTLDGEILINGSFEQALICGSHVFPAQTGRDGFVARFSDQGVLLGAWNYGKVSSQQGSVLPIESGFYLSHTFDSTLVFGSTVVPSNFNLAGNVGGGDLLLAKFGELSGFSGVQHYAPSGGHGGLHIYANPTSGVCTVELPAALQATSGLVLSVYDNTGQLVQRVPLQQTGNGVVLDIRAQARGVYHVELGDGEQRYTGTIVFE